jgi:uncharacterized protein YyaL (SSP411 family)
LQKALAEDRPILLSIGYSACHWCHVMAHECFENQEIAALMNRLFVNIKVDREERPDLDTLYMHFVQSSTGSGGWPLTVFLTPRQVPYFGGTYFPPADRMGRPGFPRVLMAAADAYQQKQAEIQAQAPLILKHLDDSFAFQHSTASLHEEVLDDAYRELSRRFDWEKGGFGQAPKFPSPMNLDFCLRYHRRTGRQEPLDFVQLTLRKMAQGGIYDQLGGGFHRYSVDEAWQVPHFEKMLYDNALLSRVYLHAYQITGDPHHRRITTETLDYIAREMISPEGGFYSTQDADSEGEEGKFFLWTTAEIEDVLGPGRATPFCRAFDVTFPGNFENGNILHMADPDQFPTLSADPDLAESRQRLFQWREKRIKPFRDEKMLTAWNGMMLSSFAEAGAALARNDYLEIASRNAEFLLGSLCSLNRVFRCFTHREARLRGYLEDYAFLIEGLLTLYEIKGENSWLRNAHLFAGEMVNQFWEEEKVEFFFTAGDHEPLIARPRDYYDNATPAGSSVAVLSLLRLSQLGGDENWARVADQFLQKMSPALAQFPSAFGYLLGALDYRLGPLLELEWSISPAVPGSTSLQEVLWGQYLPNKIIRHAHLEKASSYPANLRKGENKFPGSGKPAVLVCYNNQCQPAIADAEELKRILGQSNSPKRRIPSP